MIALKMHSKWIFPPQSPSAKLTELTGGDPLLAQILASRGVGEESALYYLSPESLQETAPEEIEGLTEAVKVIRASIEAGEKITVYGDYDVDGTTSAALLYLCLQELGALVDFYIPNRFREGYGLNSEAVVKIKSIRKSKLLITCDCGISNYDEVKLARTFGLKVIVTDHHSIPAVLPPANAVLNPKFLPENHPLHWLPGVGVVYKLAQALYGSEKAAQHLDLVALGIIADLAPLKAENRILVKLGLPALLKTQKVGLQCLLKESGYGEGGEEAVGFAVAPRINAAGRLADAELAVELFTTNDLLTAQNISRQLSSQNAERQQLCDQIFEQAMLRLTPENPESQQRSICLYDPSWNHGVVGIVASRLVERFHKPVFLGSLDEEKSVVKCSGRGIEGLDLFEELNALGDLLLKYGGHKAAAGLSMDQANWNAFTERLNASLEQKLANTDTRRKLKLDALLTPAELKGLSLERLEKLAPYGFGFPKPVFALESPVSIDRLRALGRDEAHTLLLVTHSGGSDELIKWRSSPSELMEGLDADAGLCLAFSLFKGKRGGDQLELKDLKAPLNAKLLLKQLVAGLKQLAQGESNASFSLTLPELNSLCLEASLHSHLLALEVLAESGFLSFELKEQSIEINVLGKLKKTDLDTSELKRSLALQNLK